MLISVIVPIYNEELHLKQCIDSILKQTHPIYQLILVNDGSTDKSQDICNLFAQKYKNIECVHKINQGLGMARNSGLEKATGEYVTFIDADDYIDPTFIERLVNTIKISGADTCKTSFRRVDLKNNIISEDNIVPGEYIDEDIKDKLIPRMIGSSPDKKDAIPMSACCTLYNLNIIKQNKLSFVSEREWISEDLIFNIDYFTYSKHTILLDEIGYNYRKNTESLTTIYLEDRFERSLEFYNKEKQLLENKGMYELCKYRLIRQFFINLRTCFFQLIKHGDSLKFRAKLKRIFDMCNNTDVQKMIRIYPVDKLGFAQKSFVYLVKYKRVLPIYIYFFITSRAV